MGQLRAALKKVGQFVLGQIASKGFAESGQVKPWENIVELVWVTSGLTGSKRKLGTVDASHFI